MLIFLGSANYHLLLNWNWRDASIQKVWAFYERIIFIEIFTNFCYLETGYFVQFNLVKNSHIANNISLCTVSKKFQATSNTWTKKVFFASSKRFVLIFWFLNTWMPLKCLIWTLSLILQKTCLTKHSWYLWEYRPFTFAFWFFPLQSKPHRFFLLGIGTIGLHCFLFKSKFCFANICHIFCYLWQIFDIHYLCDN